MQHRKRFKIKRVRVQKMKIVSLLALAILALTHAGSILAGTMCKIRQNPSIENEYEHELGGLQSLGWKRSTGKAKAIFISVFDKNGSIIPGPQEISGDILKTKEQENGNISISFSMPSGEKYLLRTFNSSTDKVMLAYGALINETAEGPQLSLSYGREFLDCMSFDL